MTHREALDCPCKPVSREQVGGGSVLVHRDMGSGRLNIAEAAPDRYCRQCQSWHLLGHPHLA